MRGAGLEPLERIRVVEASFYVPGPFCCLVLARLGAEVIKVEPKEEGDPMRSLDRGAFARLNAAKKSVCLDLKSTGGQRDFRRIVETSDVLVEGFRPGVMDRLGLGEEALRAANPRLVYVSISGYGQSGPLRDRAGHDINYMALAGAFGRARSPLSIPFADFAAGGLYGALGILSALIARQGSGRGRYLDLAMHEGLLSFSLLASELGSAEERLCGRLPDYGIYETKDGPITVGALEGKFWKRLCAAVGRADLEHKQTDPSTRAALSSVFRERTRAEWARVFRDADVCIEPLLEPGEAVEHPQARHRLRTRTFQLPFGLETVELGPAPELGAHTAIVLDSLGSDPDGSGAC
jgi:crotonobetainyl-CoA:carnitine CoA-transferase CaiB-like acyl-CoA transferase